jgi:hypothetical protein
MYRNLFEVIVADLPGELASVINRTIVYHSRDALLLPKQFGTAISKPFLAVTGSVRGA